jgi:hypothetical protein
MFDFSHLRATLISAFGSAVFSAVIVAAAVLPAQGATAAILGL